MAVLCQGAPAAEDALQRLDEEASMGMPVCDTQWNIQARSRPPVIS